MKDLSREYVKDDSDKLVMMKIQQETFEKEQ
jgi:hypothetical protein